MPKVPEAMHVLSADAQTAVKFGRAADLKNANDRTFEHLSARLGNRKKAYSKRPTPLRPPVSSELARKIREASESPDLDRQKRVRYKCAKHMRRRAAAAAFERARQKKTLRAARRFGKGAKNEHNERKSG